MSEALALEKQTIKQPEIHQLLKIQCMEAGFDFEIVMQSNTYLFLPTKFKSMSILVIEYVVFIGLLSELIPEKQGFPHSSLHASWDGVLCLVERVSRRVPNSPGAAVVLCDCTVGVQCWRALEADIVAAGS